MLFNSGVFLKFFAGFLLLYWLVRSNIRARNILIVAASYLFYGWWDYRFLGLILFSSVLDYFVGLGIARQTDARRRRLWLTLSIVANLRGAEGIGFAQDLGSLEEGKLADLVILAKDPLQDIRNTNSVRYVMKNGELFEGDTLDRVWPTQKAMPKSWWATVGRGK